jgi:hypothetical protein
MYALGVLINRSFSFNQLNSVALRLGFSVEFEIAKIFSESTLKLRGFDYN